MTQLVCKRTPTLQASLPNVSKGICLPHIRNRKLALLYPSERSTRRRHSTAVADSARYDVLRLVWPR